MILILFFTVHLSSFGETQSSCRDILISNNHKYSASLVADFEYRDSLPPTEIPRSEWETCCGRYGPFPLEYPKVSAPNDYDRVKWLQDRVIAVAKRYIGLPYKHKHLPHLGGLDCSNFTSWVYNYGLGISFVSNIRRQAFEVGRKINKDEFLEVGDLIYVWSEDRSWVSHVVIYIGDNKVIDSYGPGVKVRDFDGWYKSHFAWARRIIE